MDIKVGRFCLGVEIYDNETKKDIFHDGGNYSSKQSVINVLEEAIKELNKTN